MSARSPRLAALLAGLTLAASLTGCGLKQEIVNTRDTGLDTLNTAIQQLEQQSSMWREVLEKTKTDLIAAGQSTLANEVSNIAARALSDAGIEARCYTDFLGDRTLTMLRRLRAKITGLLQPDPQCRRPQSRARASPRRRDRGLQPLHQRGQGVCRVGERPRRRVHSLEQPQ